MSLTGRGGLHPDESTLLKGFLASANGEHSPILTSIGECSPFDGWSRYQVRRAGIRKKAGVWIRGDDPIWMVHTFLGDGYALLADAVSTAPPIRSEPPPKQSEPDPFVHAMPLPPSPANDPWADLKRLPLLHGDLEHIQKHIHGRSQDDQARIVAGYVERWRSAADTEPFSFRKANVGRRAANIWLRKVAA